MQSNNHLKKTLLCSYVILNFYYYSFSQPDPIKYGKIDKALLEMKVYDKDTTADAVVVCDYGNFEPNQFNFTRIYRLKILKKSGCDRANFIMGVRSKSSIKGCTYNLVNGEIVKDKLKSESIFEEKVTWSRYRYRVTMPNVQVGSVIDIEVYFTGIPYTWYFQQDIPVMWSELRLYEPSGIGIQKNFFGFQYLSINENGRWVGKDMPALKPEPFMNDIDNFLTKFELEFSYINVPWFHMDFATSWDAVSNCLLDKSSFGDELRTIFFMGQDAKNIEDTAKTAKAKMIAAYETIRKKIKWNEKDIIFPKSTIKYAMSKGSGNVGDVNLALILLLRKLNIETYPVALSTRRNGMLSFIFPTIDKLNYVIALAKINSEDVLLDATEDYLPAGYLPERCINGNGRLINDKFSIWTELKPGGKDKTKLYADLKIKNDGNITGNLNYSNQEYAGYLFRKKFYSFNDSNEFIKSYERDNPGLHILTSTFQNVSDIYSPANIKYSIEYNGNNDVSDSSISFLPFIVEQIKINPFKPEERKIPVDFIYPYERKYIIKFEIPDSFKVAEKPEPVNFALPENNGKFIFRVSSQGNIIMVNCDLSISKAVFTQDAYPYLKQLYSEIVKKESEPIIIKKK